MKKNILLSVVIPIYNKEKYLNFTLQSLSYQSYKNCEFILVDDCSNDSSIDICKKWLNSDSRFKLIRNKLNLGASISRNVGLKHAFGEYVCFIDADDVVEKNFFSDLLREGIGGDVLMCGASMIDDTGNITRQLKNNFDTSGWYSGFEFWKNFQWMLSSALWNKLFKRELLLRNKSIFKDIKGPEDLLFNFDTIKENTTIYYDCRSLYCYRIVSGSLSKTFGLEEEINDIDVLLKINEYLLNNGFVGFNNVIRTALIKLYKVLKCHQLKEDDKRRNFVHNQLAVIKKQLRKTKLSLRNRADIFEIKIKKYN